MSLLSHQLIEWLKQHSDRLDQSPQHADELLTRIAQAEVFKYGCRFHLVVMAQISRKR